METSPPRHPSVPCCIDGSVTRIACVNAFSGASGDMFLGAIVDLGIDPADLEATLRRLPLPGLRLEVREVTRQGLRAHKVAAVFEGKEPTFRTLGQVKEALRGSSLDPALLREGRSAPSSGSPPPRPPCTARPRGPCTSTSSVRPTRSSTSWARSTAGARSGSAGPSPGR